MIVLPERSLHSSFCDLSKDQPKKQVSMIRTYHINTLQTNPPHREEEPQNNNNHKTPGNIVNQLSLAHKDDCKTSKGTNQCTTRHETNTEPHNGITINDESTTTERGRLRTDSSLGQRGRGVLKCTLFAPNLCPIFCSC